MCVNRQSLGCIQHTPNIQHPHSPVAAATPARNASRFSKAKSAADIPCNATVINTNARVDAAVAAGQRASLQPSDSARDKLHVAPSCAVTARVRDLRPPPHAAEQRPNDDHGPTVHTEAASEPRRDCCALERVTRWRITPLPRTVASPSPAQLAGTIRKERARLAIAALGRAAPSTVHVSLVSVLGSVRTC